MDTENVVTPRAMTGPVRKRKGISTPRLLKEIMKFISEHGLDVDDATSELINELKDVIVTEATDK